MTVRSASLLGPPAAATAAAALNAALFWALRGSGFFGPGVVATAARAPLTVAHVALASASAVLGASLLRLALGRALVPHGRARRVFLLVSAAALAASFASPLIGLVGAGPVEVVALEVMHVVTALAAVGGAEWAARPRWRFGAESYRERSVAPRTALVTGATSGIGAQVALELARRGFRVVGVGRSRAKADAVERAGAGATAPLTILTGDLASMVEARALAARANELVAPPGFALVVHCAGTLKASSVATPEGIDENFAASFLGRYCLSSALQLAPGARAVHVAAAEGGTLPAMMRFDLRAPSDIGRGMRSHGQAQLANDLWTAWLARPGAEAIGYGPGAVDTGIRRELPSVLVALMKPVFAVDTRPPRDAALDVVRLLLDVDLPARGFASREGHFAHDPFVLDPARQDALVALADRLIDGATGRGGGA